jgi:hypothetical protein
MFVGYPGKEEEGVAEEEEGVVGGGGPGGGASRSLLEYFSSKPVFESLLESSVLTVSFSVGFSGMGSLERPRKGGESLASRLLASVMVVGHWCGILPSGSNENCVPMHVYYILSRCSSAAHLTTEETLYLPSAQNRNISFLFNLMSDRNQNVGAEIRK